MHPLPQGAREPLRGRRSVWAPRREPSSLARDEARGGVGAAIKERRAQGRSVDSEGQRSPHARIAQRAVLLVDDDVGEVGARARRDSELRAARQGPEGGKGRRGSRRYRPGPPPASAPARSRRGPYGAPPRAKDVEGHLRRPERAALRLFPRVPPRRVRARRVLPREPAGTPLDPRARSAARGQ